MKLREQLFADAFLLTGCAVKAAAKTGIRGRSRKSASAFLKRPGVQRIINDEMSMRAKARGITEDRVLNELAVLAFSNMSDFARWSGAENVLFCSDEISRSRKRAVQSVSSKMSAQGVPNVTIKLYDKAKALEVLARYLGIIGPESEGNKRPQAREIALRIRAMLAEAEEASGGEPLDTVSDKTAGEGS